MKQLIAAAVAACVLAWAGTAGAATVIASGVTGIGDDETIDWAQYGFDIDKSLAGHTLQLTTGGGAELRWARVDAYIPYRYYYYSPGFRSTAPDDWDINEWWFHLTCDLPGPGESCSVNGGSDDFGRMDADFSNGLLTFRWEPPVEFNTCAEMTPFQLCRIDVLEQYVRLDVGIHWGDTPGHYTLSAVPEPATWAMMIAGFGLVGTGLRRARRPLAFHQS